MSKAYHDIMFTMAIAAHGRDCKKCLISCTKHEGNYIAYCNICNSEIYTWDSRKPRQIYKLVDADLDE